MTGYVFHELPDRILPVTELASPHPRLIHGAFADLEQNRELLLTTPVPVAVLNMCREPLFCLEGIIAERTGPLTQMHLHFVINPFPSSGVKLVWIFTPGSCAHVRA